MAAPLRTPTERPPISKGYGVDAPYVPLALALFGTGLEALAVVSALSGSGPLGVAVTAIAGAWFLALTGVFLHTTLRGKFACWHAEVAALGLSGDESVLDVGCGRGAVLAIVARAIPRGRAVGIDLWRSRDQSGNDQDVTRSNVEAAGLGPVELYTADMVELPFADQSFDLVVSSVAVHNVDSDEKRAGAIGEMARVLRPGGRLLIADFRHSGDYEEIIGDLGWADVEARNLGWRFWYSGPWMATTMLAATKPNDP
jgi:arsenite methyltransferase